MRVGWLSDQCTYIGGAERTQAEFRAAAPDYVEVVDCPAGGVVQGLDRYVINNCVTYSPEELCPQRLGALTPVFKYWNDIGPHITPEQHGALALATPVCTSPLQADRMKLDAVLIPPAVPLDPFREAAENAGERQGAVSVGTWMNPGKAPEAAAEWAAGNGGIDFYGSGPYAPPGSQPVEYDDLPEILARYKTFVHLPIWIEPFGRAVVEAWASGCEIVTNRLVGARYWITEEPDKLETASSDLWELVLA